MAENKKQKRVINSQAHPAFGTNNVDYDYSSVFYAKPSVGESETTKKEVRRKPKSMYGN